jgi:hypothetical protein
MWMLLNGQRKPNTDIGKVACGAHLKLARPASHHLQSLTKSNNPAFEKSSFAIGFLMSRVGSRLRAVIFPSGSVLERRPLSTELSISAVKVTPSMAALALIWRGSSSGKLIVVLLCRY